MKTFITHTINMLLYFLLLAGLTGRNVLADFTYSAPTQCENFNIVWSGGSPPFSLLLAGVSTGKCAYLSSLLIAHRNLDADLRTRNLRSQEDTPARNISIPSSAYDGSNGNYTLQLALPEELIFIAVLSDANGIGSLGITNELTVNTSTTTCNTTVTPSFSVNFTGNLQQCQDFTFTQFNAAAQVRTPRFIFVTMDHAVKPGSVRL
jgi:hypothetical protein